MKGQIKQFASGGQTNSHHGFAWSSELMNSEQQSHSRNSAELKVGFSVRHQLGSGWMCLSPAYDAKPAKWSLASSGKRAISVPTDIGQHVTLHYLSWITGSFVFTQVTCANLTIEDQNTSLYDHCKIAVGDGSGHRGCVSVCVQFSLWLKSALIKDFQRFFLFPPVCFLFPHSSLYVLYPLYLPLRSQIRQRYSISEKQECR